MMNIDGNFRKIINPPIDFLFKEELSNNKKYLNLVYEKIVSEMVNFSLREENIKVIGFKLDKQKYKDETDIILNGRINIEAKKQKHEIIISFNNTIIEMFFDNENIGYSEIHGSEIDKELLTASKIKADLSSFKEEIINKIS